MGNMKFEILQEELLKGLSFVVRAVATRAQLPILSTILVEAKKDGITLTATDLELALKTKVFGKTLQEGLVAVPAKILLDLVGTVGQGKLEAELVKESLIIEAAGYKGKIQTVSADEYPRPPELPREGGYELPAKGFGENVGRVVFASAKDVLRPVLTGVLIEPVAGGIKLVATDGFRLAMAKTGGKGKLEKSYLVPARAIAEASRIDGESLRIVALSENQVGIVCGENTIMTQTIDGNFPEYSKIVPKEFVTTLEVPREELLTAVKSVYVFARDNSNMIRWNVGGDKIVMKAEAPEKGEGEAEVMVKTEGEGGEIVFNAKFVMEFLANSSAETIQFSMNDNLKPGAFKEKGNEDYLYIIMPINA